jgi:hypothetical protein
LSTLQHAYALTAHSIQGGTAEWAGVVGRPEDFTRNWSYTALSRAREATELFLIDTPTDHELDRAEIAPDQALELHDQRTPVDRLEAAMCRRDDESLALDRIDDIGAQPPTGRHVADANAAAANGLSRRPVDELRTELAQLHERIGRYPEHLAEQLHAARNARAEAQRVADVARERIAQLEQPTGGVLRRRTADPAALSLERQRLQLADDHAAAAAERERDFAGRVPDRAAWKAERQPLRERADALEAQLSIRRQEHLRDALEHPGPYLSAALGQLPNQPRARSTWQQAATHIEAYRFDHAMTGARDALGLPPADTRERAHWQRARQELQRAQRDLGQRIDRGPSHEL